MSQVRVKEPKIQTDEESLRNVSHVLIGPTDHVVKLENRKNVILMFRVNAVYVLAVGGAHHFLVTTLPDAFFQTLQWLSCSQITEVVGNNSPIIYNNCVQNYCENLVVSEAASLVKSTII